MIIMIILDFFLILILIDFCHQKLIVVEFPEQKFIGFYDLGSVFFSYYYCWKLGVRYVLFFENVCMCVFLNVILVWEWEWDWGVRTNSESNPFLWILSAPTAIISYIVFNFNAIYISFFLFLFLISFCFVHLYNQTT